MPRGGPRTPGPGKKPGAPKPKLQRSPVVRLRVGTSAMLNDAARTAGEVPLVFLDRLIREAWEKQQQQTYRREE